jgi:hypothetical protein
MYQWFLNFITLISILSEMFLMFPLFFNDLRSIDETTSFRYLILESMKLLSFVCSTFHDSINWEGESYGTIFRRRRETQDVEE